MLPQTLPRTICLEENAQCRTSESDKKALISHKTEPEPPDQRSWSSQRAKFRFEADKKNSTIIAIEKNTEEVILMGQAAYWEKVGYAFKS